jgi:hypothetical protein
MKKKLYGAEGSKTIGFFFVPNVFPSSSHNAPITFQMGPKYSQHVTYIPNVFFNMFPIAPHFVPYALPNCGALGTYIN